MGGRFSAVVWVRVICALLALVLAVVLLAARKPWEILAEIGVPGKPQHYAAIYEWWAGLINLGLLVALAATATWWMRPTAPPHPGWFPSVPTPRWFWPLVGLAMLVTAVLGAPRLSHSLWDDEDYSVRRAIMGDYRRGTDGTLKFREVRWENTLWYYKKPTNHHLQSLLSKVSLNTWQAVAQPKGLQLSETAVRLPSYLAGILSIGALAIFLKRLGFARAAVLAAFLLALHPWHVRYATEARGYIFCLLFLPLMLTVLLQALETGRWRWWAAFAAAELAALYAYPGCLYVLVIANLCGLVALLVRGKDPVQWLRLPVASLIAGMIYLQLMLPCVPQLREYLATDVANGVLTPRWHRNLGAHFLTGMAWNNSDQPAAGFPELQWTAEAHPTAYALAVFAVVAAVAAGLVRLALRRPAGPTILPILILPGLLVYGAAVAGGNYLYEWYLIFALPGAVGLAALGLDALAQSTSRWHRAAPLATLLVATGVFAYATASPRRILVRQSLEPMREAVLLTRPDPNPHAPGQKDILTLALNAPPLTYDPNLVIPESKDDMVAHLRAADESGKPLFVTYANGWAAAYERPAELALVEDERYFEKIASLPGFHPTLTFFVRRYKPGSIDR